MNTCIEKRLVDVQKYSAFDIQQTNRYITYDNCNNKILASYGEPAFTSFAISIFTFAIIMIIIIGIRNFVSKTYEC